MITSARAVELLLAWPGLAARRVDAVWLFGSQASGRAGPQSDIDLAILCDPPLGLERTRAIDEIGRAAGHDIDIVDLATAPAPLRWEVITTGQIVVERDEELVERYVRQARYDAEDADQLNRLALLARVEHVGGASR